MEKKLFTISSDHDGLELSCMMILPEISPRGIIQLCHGMAEHKGRYEDFMTYLAGQGFVTIIHDHRGHGGSVRSTDDLGHFYEKGASGAIKDIHQITLYIKEAYPDLPLFLFGHSMGSLMARCYIKRYDKELAGAIICGSPSANPAAGVARVLCTALGAIKGDHSHSPMLVNLVSKNTSSDAASGESPFAWLSYNEENVKRYEEDPLCGFPFTINGYYSLMTYMADCYDPKDWRVTNSKLPIHFIAGEEDPCIQSPEKFAEAVSFIEERGYETVTSILYPNMRHEILNETDKDMVYEDVAEFITSCL